ncbi:MAG: 30S ribosomal protein S20 [Bacillota bacterium]
MPNIKSAIKRVKITAKRTARNRHVKSTVRTAIRSFRSSLETGDAEMKLRTAVREIDKAVSKGVLHRNTGARKKSRLMKQLNKLQEAK